MEKRLEKNNPYGLVSKRALREVRNQWLAELDVSRKNERLFELEMNLKALDRFCNVRNHPINNSNNIFDRNFKVEAYILRETVTRVISFAQSLLPEEKTSSFHFQRYVERRLMSDRARMDLLERSLQQDSPEESLYVLESGMASLREMASALLSMKKVTYTLFHHLGQMISREIAWNAYFNPFEIGEFSPNHDRIRNGAIQKIVREKIASSVRKDISVIFLIAFRLLHYLQYIREEEPNRWELLQNLPVFVLVRSEISALAEYLENELPKIVAEKLPGKDSEALVAVFDSLAFQLDMESKKVYQLEIKDVVDEKEVNRLLTGMARGKGVLVEILRQLVVQLARGLDPTVEGRHIFMDFISRNELSLKLRKDLWIFQKVVENLNQNITDDLPKREYKPVLEALKSLRNYIFYFQNVSFQMVRFTDRGAFEDFFHAIDEFSAESVYEQELIDELHGKIRAFGIFLETTLGNVSQRGELKDQPFGTREGEHILQQFLK